jgi:hypothetical protein
LVMSNEASTFSDQVTLPIAGGFSNA